MWNPGNRILRLEVEAVPNSWRITALTTHSFEMAKITPVKISIRDIPCFSWVLQTRNSTLQNTFSVIEIAYFINQRIMLAGQLCSPNDDYTRLFWLALYSKFRKLLIWLLHCVNVSILRSKMLKNVQSFFQYPFLKAGYLHVTTFPRKWAVFLNCNKRYIRPHLMNLQHLKWIKSNFTGATRDKDGASCIIWFFPVLEKQTRMKTGTDSKLFQSSHVRFLLTYKALPAVENMPVYSRRLQSPTLWPTSLFVEETIVWGQWPDSIIYWLSKATRTDMSKQCSVRNIGLLVPDLFCFWQNISLGELNWF